MVTTVKVTNAGLAIVTNRIKGSGTEPKYVGWGTGTTTAAVANTGLETAAAEARTSGTSTQETSASPAVTNDTYQVVGTITCSGSGKAITEVVLMDADTNGNCFLRATFSAINVDVGDSIQFTIKVTFTTS